MIFTSSHSVLVRNAVRRAVVLPDQAMGSAATFSRPQLENRSANGGPVTGECRVPGVLRYLS